MLTRISARRPRRSRRSELKSLVESSRHYCAFPLMSLSPVRFPSMSQPPLAPPTPTPHRWRPDSGKKSMRSREKSRTARRGFPDQVPCCVGPDLSGQPVVCRNALSISVIQVRSRGSLELALEQAPVLGDAAVHSFAPEAKT